MNNWYGVIMTSMSFMDVFLSKSPICNIHMKKEKKNKKEACKCTQIWKLLLPVQTSTLFVRLVLAKPM